MAKQPKVVKEQKVYIVTAPFETQEGYQTVRYEVGDEFLLPEDWQYDTGFDEFRNMKENGRPGEKKSGIPFNIPVPVLDDKGKLKYMDVRRVILPVEERTGSKEA